VNTATEFWTKFLVNIWIILTTRICNSPTIFSLCLTISIHIIFHRPTDTLLIILIKMPDLFSLMSALIIRITILIMQLRIFLVTKYSEIFLNLLKSNLRSMITKLNQKTSIRHFITLLTIWKRELHGNMLVQETFQAHPSSLLTEFWLMDLKVTMLINGKRSYNNIFNYNDHIKNPTLKHYIFTHYEFFNSHITKICQKI